jgi:hypothetical protein
MSGERDYRDHHLSRIYREGAWPEPSRQIDQAILAASRRERSFARRWAPSFAVAATVVLTSALVLRAYQEQPEVVSASGPEKQAATPAKQPPAAGESKPAESKSAATPASAPQAVATPRGFISTMDAGEAERLDRLSRDLSLKQGPVGAPSPPALKAAPAEKPGLALKKETSETGRAADQHRPETAAGASAVRARESQAVIAPVSVFGASPPAQQSARAVGKPALPFTQSNQSAPAQAPAEAAKSKAEEADRMQAAPAASPEPAPPPPAAPSIALQRSPGAGAAAKTVERSPQTWIEDIRKLMKEGKSEEAGREIAEFKNRYPAFVLPEDLR